MDVFGVIIFRGEFGTPFLSILGTISILKGAILSSSDIKVALVPGLYHIQLLVAMQKQSKRDSGEDLYQG